MSGIGIGSGQLSKLSIGSTPIQKVSLGSSLVWSAGASYTDNFNRANATTLGSSWRVDVNSQPQIVSNHAQFKTPNSGDGRAGNWVSYVTALNTDNYGVDIQLSSTSGSAATNNFTGAVLAIGDTFGSGMMCYGLVSTGSGCLIVTQSGAVNSPGISSGQSGQTSRATTATNVVNTDAISFKRSGNVFTLYKNGSSILSWTDTGNVVSSGSAYRRFGFIVEGNSSNFVSSFYSPGVDQITGYDL